MPPNGTHSHYSPWAAAALVIGVEGQDIEQVILGSDLAFWKMIKDWLNEAAFRNALPCQFLIAQSMRLIGFITQALAALGLVSLIVAFAPNGLAVAFEGQNVRGDAVQEPAIVADHHGAAAEIQERLF